MSETRELQVKLHILHPAQQRIIQEAKRFNVLKCGRRFGKTEITKELAVQTALDGFPVGYWSPTYKDMNKVWDTLKDTLFAVTKRKDEQLKQIKLITGGSIDFWSMEDPNNGRGFAYKRAIIDEAEKASKLKESWEQVIRATLVDMNGDAWFMSTPKFGQTYFKTTLYQNKFQFDNWNSWTFTSYDNPFLDPAEIEEAKKYDELTYRCEYLAEDVDNVGNPFAYAFKPEKHIGKCQYNSGHHLYLSFDFNVDPMTCIARQKIDGKHYYVKEFKIPNSDIYEMCDRIKSAFPFAVFLVTGDATGQARSAISKGNVTHYQVIQQKLNLNSTQIKVMSVNPSVSVTRTLLNSILQNESVIFDAENCPNLINDMKYVEVDSEADIIKDRKTEQRKADFLDCARYDFFTFERSYLKL